MGSPLIPSGEPDDVSDPAIWISVTMSCVFDRISALLDVMTLCLINIFSVMNLSHGGYKALLIPLLKVTIHSDFNRVRIKSMELK